jgi:uncharacterized protein (DUF2384 family)
MRVPHNAFRNIVGEIASISARREQLTENALDAVECRYPLLAQALLDHVGGRRRAAHWLCAPQRACGGKSPCELLGESDEELVWDLLDPTGMTEPSGAPRMRSPLAT